MLEDVFVFFKVISVKRGLQSFCFCPGKGTTGNNRRTLLEAEIINCSVESIIKKTADYSYNFRSWSTVSLAEGKSLC